MVEIKNITKHRKGMFTLVDASGKMVKRNELNLTNGEQGIMLPMADLSSGIHFVLINSASVNHSQKLIIE